MSRTIFYGPKDVRAIEVRLYVKIPGNATTKKHSLPEATKEAELKKKDKTNTT